MTILVEKVGEEDILHLSSIPVCQFAMATQNDCAIHIMSIAVSIYM